MQNIRWFVALCSVVFSLALPFMAESEETVTLPPVHNSSKVLTEKSTPEQAAPMAEDVDLKKELVPDNIGKDVQIRSYVRKTDQAKVSEYSMHGRVYMVKVQPAGDTPAYYLYDEDGDGDFSKRLPANYKRLNPPVWVLKKF
ncbi:MAG: DUF2782 domain-containing protein [Mariprofundaceae bacterium]|nr:DUF2782 domain-containing protein [Mariprofundaceae bacterium]